MEALDTKLKGLLNKYGEVTEGEFDKGLLLTELKSAMSQSEVAKQSFQVLRKQRLNAEHQLSQLEKQLISCNNRLGKESSELAKVQKQLEERGNSLEEKQDTIRKLDDEKTELSTKCNKALQKNSSLEDEKASMLEILEKKSKEIERLNEEWKNMSKSLSEANKAKYEAQSQLDEIKSSDITREFKLKRIEQEKDLLASQSSHLRAELNAKAEELAGIKKNKTNEVFDLHALSDQQKDEIKKLTSSLENFKAKNEEQEEKLNRLMEKLKQAREDMAENESHLEKELAAKTKLVDLYKESSEDSKRKMKEMNVALDELKKMFTEAEDKNSDLQSRLDLCESERTQEVEEFEIKIKQLCAELDNANDLLEVSRNKAPALSKEAIAEMSPSAAAASALMKKGMSLTQIYSEYVQVSDALELEKDETAKLRKYLDQILQEIEEKAPVLQRQKEDYELALKTIENLTTKFNATLTECERYRSEQEDAIRKSDFNKRENGRLNTLCADLSQQVRILLKEVEEARGGVVSTEYQTPEVTSSDNVSSSSQVISEHLVSFRNIEELQEQNQKLLAVVRDLSEEREKQEKECSPEKLKQLAGKLDFAFEQINQLKEEREKQENIIQTLVKQRDMYKVLYNAEDRPEVSSTSFLQQSFQVSSAEAESELEKSKAYLNQVTDEYEKYKQDYKEKESSLQEKMEKIEEEVSSLRVENQILKGKVEFMEEKDGMLKKTNEGLKREADALTEKSRGLETALSKSQKEAIFYKQELENANEKRIRSEVELKSLSTEKRLIKETEQRLLQENKTLVEQQRSRNALLTNLQTIQNNLERQEFSTRKSLGNQIENLQLEMKSLKRKMESEEHEKKSSIGSLSGQLEKVSTELESERRLRKETEETISSTNKELQTANLKCSELQELLDASESRLEALINQDDVSKEKNIEQLKEEYEERYRTLKAQISESELRTKAFESQIQSSNKHAEQYKQIAASCEEALKDSNEKYSSLQQESNRKTEAAQKRVNELNRQLQATKVELNSRKSKAEKTEQDLQFKLDQSKGSLAAIEGDYEAMKNNVKRYEEQAESAKIHVQAQMAIAQEKQEKYERELVLHAKDVEELVKVKEQLHEYVTVIDNYDAQIRDAEDKKMAAEKAMENMKLHHSQETKKLTDHSKEIAQQNSLLHKEIEKMSEQIASEKTEKIAEITKLTEGSSKSGDESTEDLYEVLRFMRREKEIAETKCEAAQSESIRYRQRCDHYEKELEETQAALELERRRTLGMMLSKEEHADIMEKVAKVAELTELQKELQKQKTELEETNEVLKNKTKQLEGEVEPLRQSKKLLEEEKGNLVAEKAALKSEIQRWTSRTQQLIAERSKATNDSEELKQLQKSKALNDKTASSLREEINRLKVQKETISKDMLKMKKDAVEYQGKVTLLTTLADTIKAEKEEADKKFTSEIDNLKKESEEKTNEVTEKVKLIGRLKSLARKYKSQFEELQKNQEGEEAKTTPASTSEDSEKLQASDEENKKLKEQLEKLQTDLNNSEKKIEELNSRLDESSQKDKDFNTNVDELRSDIERLTKENSATKATLAERDEKEERNKKILRSAKEKINDLNAQRDKLANENKDLKKSLKDQEDQRQSSDDALKEKEMRLSIIKNQLDSTVEKMEGELKEAKTENQKLVDRLQGLEEEKRLADENSEELTKAITESEDIIAKLKAQSHKSIQEHPVAEAAAFAPLTATVRPTAAAVTSQPQKPMSTRTASIRPLIPMLTPTAMVSPTVPPPNQSTTQVVNPIVSSSSQDSNTEQRSQVPDIVPGPSRGQSLVFKAPRIMATVQAQEGSVSSETQATVAPILASTISNEASATSTEPSAVSNDQQEEMEEAGDEAVSSAVVDDNFAILMPPEATEAAEAARMLDDADIEETAAEEQQYSSKQVEEQTDEQRENVNELASEAIQDIVPLETRQIEMLSGNQSSDSQPQNQENISAKRRRSLEQVSESDEDEDSDEGPEEKRQRIQPEAQQYFQDAGDDVISISDGDGVEEYEEEAEEEEVESEGSAEVIEEDEEDNESLVFEPAFGEEVIEEGEMEAGDESEEEEDMDDQDDGVENIGDDVIDDNENSGPSMTSAQAITDSLPVPTRDPVREFQRRQPSPAAFMLAAQEQGGRGRAIRRRYQLPSFSLPPGQGGSGPFDDADDCTVPSTPTLYEPKRSDGFAEAVSSPQVRHPVFSFPGGSESGGRGQQVSGLGADVTGEGLRLDDTRIDLLAGDESGSVPITPIGIVPSVTITPVSRSVDNFEMVAARQSMVPGRPRQSSTARVPQMSTSTEDNNQEQNVPQQIDLTEDDDDDDEDEDEVEEEEEEDEGYNGEQEVLSAGMQEDDLFEENSNHPNDLPEEGEILEEADEGDQIGEEEVKTEKDEEEAKIPETHDQKEQPGEIEEKEEQQISEAPPETQEAPRVLTRAATSSGLRTSNRRPRIRRTVLAGRATSKQEDKREPDAGQ